MGERDIFAPAHDALDRMRRAYRRGTGCHLTADMIRALSLTFLAQTWSDERPDTEDAENPVSDVTGRPYHGDIDGDGEL